MHLHVMIYVNTPRTLNEGAIDEYDGGKVVLTYKLANKDHMIVMEMFKIP